MGDDGGLLFGLAETVLVSSAAVLAIRRGQVPVFGRRWKTYDEAIGEGQAASRDAASTGRAVGIA